MIAYFSIIIPLYNKESYIQKTLISVINQSYKDFEIIVVNDGSTDKSLDIVNNFQDKRIKVYSIKNSGVAAARNFGIKKATSNYIAFLDADDLWEESFLNEIFKLTLEYPNETIYATGLKIKTEKKTYNVAYKNLNVNLNTVDILNYFQYSLDHSILHCANSVFSKQTIKQIGFFNESLATGEDTEYWIRSGLKHPVVFLNTPLAIHLVVENGLTKSNRKNFKSIDFTTFEKTPNQTEYFRSYINRLKFSSALKYKLVGDKKNYKNLKKTINYKALSLKQKILLNSPKILTVLLVNTYNSMTFKKNYY